MQLLCILLVVAVIHYKLLEYLRGRYYKGKLAKQLTYRAGGGYLYAFRGRGESRSFIKIGRATDPVQRLRAHQTANPHGVEVLAVCKVRDAKRAEALVHQLLEPERHNGEWFRNTYEVRCAVRAMCQQPLTRMTQLRLDEGRYHRR